MLVISIENFYWILFQNLLRPSALDCWYYYPFGTRENLSRAGEFQPYYRRYCNSHVLFHFDQEPLWQNDLGTLYDIEYGGITWSKKYFRALANSEHSDLKKTICRDRGLQDWYYFYHGFAALDWFRDTRLVQECQDVSSAFVSLNHEVKGERVYRLALTARLIEQGILDRGITSLMVDQATCQGIIDQDNSYLADQDRSMIQQHIMSGSLPLIADSTSVNAAFSARLGHQEYRMLQSALLHVVNETVFYAPKLHLTEKIFKPIVTARPFVLVASPGSLSYLRGYGFRTFDDWIDESYDVMTDAGARLDAVAREIAKIAALSQSQLRSLHQDMRSVLDYNKKHFFGDFRRIIVDELVDNFEQCVRQWNNGRWEHRVALPADTASIKISLMSS